MTVITICGVHTTLGPCRAVYPCSEHTHTDVFGNRRSVGVDRRSTPTGETESKYSDWPELAAQLEAAIRSKKGNGDECFHVTEGCNACVVCRLLWALTYPGEASITLGASAGSGEPETVDVVAAVRRDEDGNVWLAKRNADGAHAGLAGMWEYPGGKVEPNEQLREAMVRELHEEFPGVEVHVGKVLDSINATLEGTGEDDATLRVRVYRVTFFEVTMTDPTELPCHTEVRWMTPEEACSVDHLPSGTIFNATHLAGAKAKLEEAHIAGYNAAYHEHVDGFEVESFDQWFADNFATPGPRAEDEGRNDPSPGSQVDHLDDAGI